MHVDVTAKQDHSQVVRTGHNLHIMRKSCLIEHLPLVAFLSVLATGCQQADQVLPFELSEGEGATITIGTTGGTISVPPSFSLQFPAGSLPASVSVGVTPLITAPFPDGGGVAVPGSAYDVGPAGTMLAVPARVQIAVPPALLEIGDDVRLSVAVLRQNGSIAIFGGTYDLTNGFLTADVDELGWMAAVVAEDALAVARGIPPALGGGAVPPPSPAPFPSGPALSSHGGVQFSASCAPTVRQCFTSGLIRVWADDVVRERLGDELFLLSPSVEASLEFLDFDQNGVPTNVVGSITMDGEVRARINRVVSRYQLDDGVHTGSGDTPAATTLSISGNVMTFGLTRTSANFVEPNEQFEFGVTGIGTSEMLTIRVEAEVTLRNEDGTETIGTIVAHVRLRR